MCLGVIVIVWSCNVACVSGKVSLGPLTMALTNRFELGFGLA
jgi:hypothetical protein